MDPHWPARVAKRWAFVGPRGSLWVSVGPCGSPWIPVGPCGSLWVPMGPLGPVGPRGPPCPCGSPWAPARFRRRDPQAPPLPWPTRRKLTSSLCLSSRVQRKRRGTATGWTRVSSGCLPIRDVKRGSWWCYWGFEPRWPQQWEDIDVDLINSRLEGAWKFKSCRRETSRSKSQHAILRPISKNIFFHSLHSEGKQTFRYSKENTRSVQRIDL